MSCQIIRRLLSPVSALDERQGIKRNNPIRQRLILFGTELKCFERSISLVHVAAEYAFFRMKAPQTI